MEFKDFRKAIQDNFDSMVDGSTRLFEVELDKDAFWNLYLDSFPEDSNPIYRVRREHDCSCCRHFIKSIGNVVSIKKGKIQTIWDIKIDDEAYQLVADKMSEFVKSHKVTNVYLNNERRVGVEYNFGDVDGNSVRFEHFFLNVPDICFNSRRDTIDSVKSDIRGVRNVFKRSLDELSLEALETVMELICSNTLYKGEEWKNVLSEFIKHKKAYSKLTTDRAKELYSWENSVKVSPTVGKIRNTSIGTLLIDVSEGVELDEAVTKYEKVTAPTNYKRPKAIFTQRMLEEAKKTLEELGFMESLRRRYAVLDDITVNNILFSNRDSAKRIKGASDLFGEMEKDVKSTPKKFSKVEEISIADFVRDVLPTARELEVYLENKHESNMVSLIAPVDVDSKSMFRWSNGFSWAYSGNVTDSLMKERVKAAGGAVDGDLRFSIQWNDGANYDGNDLDAHCVEADGNEIYFGRHRKPEYSRNGGQLDVDIIHPSRGIPAVENITWPDRSRMKPGKYRMFVHCYSYNGGRSGFRAEIEFDGQIYSYDCNSVNRRGQTVEVAEVTLDANGNFSIKDKMPSSVTSKDVWGLKTNEFVPVSVVCYSPNYWDEQDGIGHRHYFFMLKNCINTENPNGWYNEFLNNDLNKHKRVFEALGSKAHVEDSDDQLSGIGFSSTKRAELVVKVIGQTERVMKIKF